MGRGFWLRRGPRQLPDSVRRVLVNQFELRPPDLGWMRLVEKSGQLFALTGVTADKRPVRLIRVFDSQFIQRVRAVVERYEDLECGGRRKALLFEGHIEPDGTIHLADRRPVGIATEPITEIAIEAQPPSLCSSSLAASTPYG